LQIIKRKIHEENNRKSVKPVTIRWNNVLMVANHSIRSVAREIESMSSNQDFVAINFIGKQSTGKTELMKTLAHLIHETSRLPYNVNYFGRNEMLNLEETMKSLTPTNHILIMDDIAFLNSTATSQQIHQIEQVMSVIRHLPGGKDVKIILMKSFQYSKALPPFLRQNDGTFVSSVDDNEIQNLEDLLGKKYSQKIQDLKKMRVECKISDAKGNSFFSCKIGRTGSIRYKARDPFLPFLYSNQISCRVVVSPLRTWIQPVCHICNPVEKATSKSKETLEAFLKDYTSKFGEKSIAKGAVKVILIKRGVNCFKPRIVQAVRYIEEYLDKRAFSLEDLAAAMDLSPTSTRLDPSKKPDFLDIE